MSLRPIHLLGSPVLRERAAEVRTVDVAVRALVQDLFDVMRACKGVGLAANQVGLARRVCVVETDEQHSYALVNPAVVERDAALVKDEEGCLSIPDLYAEVERSARVVVEALDAGCDCETCRVFSRGYLRHLFAAEELLGLRLLSLHNVRYLIRLVSRAREAIVAGGFGAWSAGWSTRYTARELA